jgi:hypothetical protein
MGTRNWFAVGTDLKIMEEEFTESKDPQLNSVYEKRKKRKRRRRKRKRKKRCIKGRKESTNRQIK